MTSERDEDPPPPNVRILCSRMVFAPSMISQGESCPAMISKRGHKELVKPLRSQLQRYIAARPQFLVIEADTNDCCVLLRWDGNAQCLDDMRADQVRHLASGVGLIMDSLYSVLVGSDLNYLEKAI